MTTPDLSARLPANLFLLLKNQQLRIKSKHCGVEQNDTSSTATNKRTGGKFSRHYLQHLLIPEAEVNNDDAQPVAILVTFLYGVKLKKHNLKEAIKCSTISRNPSEEETKKCKPKNYMAFLDIILVLNEDVTPPALSALNEFVKQSSNTLNIQVIKRKDLAWDKSENQYVQTYEVKESQDVPIEFLKENKITDVTKLPKIFTTDPMSKLYGFKLGQLVKAVNSMYWRIVVIENQVTQDEEDITTGSKKSNATAKKNADGEEYEDDGEVDMEQDQDIDEVSGSKKRKNKDDEDDEDEVNDIDKESDEDDKDENFKSKKPKNINKKAKKSNQNMKPNKKQTDKTKYKKKVGKIKS